MQFHVNPSGELPIYRQIMRQITDAIAGGRVAAGDQLPSHRDLAAQLVIAPLTVKKAYDELEREGLITTQRGRGTYVSESLPVVDAAHPGKVIGVVRREDLLDYYNKQLLETLRR